MTDGGNEALAGGERDGGDTGTKRVDGSAMPVEETPPHAEGSWRLVEYECENPAPDILDPFGMNICSREIGTVYEFDNGCLFGGEGCVSGLEYSATVPSSAGFPATEEV
ncbi:MAG: hypothetical protein ABIK89_20190, partial [Planctomycetota bacterium]